MCYKECSEQSISFFNAKTNYFENSLFLEIITEWNDLAFNIGNSISPNLPKNSVLKFIRSEPNQILISIVPKD